MDNHENEKDNYERRNSNTEYLPTKCRVTRPPPPKPATNPLQFIKVAPCPLFQKAQEQIKKVEEIKKERKEIRDETEDWQQNLDNWKSSRRKRQEHIIERVVEVKKLTEQEEYEKARRKSKTFSEMMEERNKSGRHKFTIPIYDDDSNDLSDYGIGSSSSKTNSVKDNDTDDSSSLLDEKEHISDPQHHKDNSSTSNQSQSEDETNNLSNKKEEDSNKTLFNNTESINDNSKRYSSTYTTTLSSNKPSKPAPLPKPKTNFESKLCNDLSPKESSEHYTYEGAIQDYRSRITSKIKVDESIFTRNKDFSKSREFSEAQSVLPKGEISKRKGLFEFDKVEINSLDNPTTRRLSEDFVNARSIKDRLKSLEQSVDQATKGFNKNDIQVSVKERLQSFSEITDAKNIISESKPRPNKISNYLLDKSSSTPAFESPKPVAATKELNERCYSPENDIYMNKLNTFSRDLDTLMSVKLSEDNTSDYSSNSHFSNSNYPPSSSSMDLTGASSDRDDSGIHTTDVSCSVSQADEPVDTDVEATTNHISDNHNMESKKEILEKPVELLAENYPEVDEKMALEEKVEEDVSYSKQVNGLKYTLEEVILFTKEFLEELIRDATESINYQMKYVEEVKEFEMRLQNHVEECPKVSENNQPKPVIYENVEIKPHPNSAPIEFISDDMIAPFSLTPPKLEPPKVKPPPPPPPDDENEAPPQPIKRLNSTKRIKKEMHIKRNSFLGLDDQNIDLIDPDMIIEKPPDINSFLQKESKLEKSLYKKMQEENRGWLLSKVESQDSGLDIDRGRLSSDTWCSSIGDSSTPSHERQDSEQTNSITSEEDEITKKEREIIEMVEKEEKSRDSSDYVNHKDVKQTFSVPKSDSVFQSNLETPHYSNGFLSKETCDFLKDQDSEVLRVEHELAQLEREELERQRENLLFRESRAKARLQNNRRSLENICDDIYPCYANTAVNYRKSMPELPQMPLEYRKSVPDVPSTYNMYAETNHMDLKYRKSMPDIQTVYKNSSLSQLPLDNIIVDHRKSLPDLQHDMHRSAFKSPPPINRQPIMPGKPLRTIKEPCKVNSSQSTNLKTKQLSKHSLQALSAAPRPRHVPNDVWIQPKPKPEVKSYNQHWVFQEAEHRRLLDQNNTSPSKIRNQPRQEKPLPDSIIQTLTQRVQNRNSERSLPVRRVDGSPSKDFRQYQYIDQQQTVGYALPTTMPFTPPIEETQDKILSVSGKKKCSYCSSELGRGAAMIIESLCLFYHMECFKCCVCHIQLGDGRMGTDVRVRNQKLHCHNCYSSDDGVKFSCV